MPDEKNGAGIHKDHRRRVRNNVLLSGADSLPDHGLLELMLFETTPRRDVNATVHALSDGFGISGALDWDAAERTQAIAGETSSRYLQTLGAVCERYIREARFSQTSFVSLFSARRFFMKNVDGSAPHVTLMALNDRLSEPRFFVYPSPERDDPELAQTVSRDVLSGQAGFLFVGFSHPGGFLVPQTWERDFIRRLFYVCALGGSYFAEAVIASEDGARGVSDMRLLPPATFLFRPTL